MRGSMLAVLLLAGCGISDGTLLADLEPEERTELCTDGGEETFTCEMDGLSVESTFGSADCGEGVAVPDDCAATVGDYRDCDKEWRAALREDPCAAETPEACAPLFECLGLGG